ncbi:hypothetical protein MMC09_000171 [Bachmanniomyces sp. S44760]|nr:hypothetical protein [Bachmanniomyces sp. S44760]
MNNDFAALRAYASGTPEYYPPRSTVSLAETTLLTPTSPDDEYMIKEEHDDEPRGTKKRKSWGQELPTPKTNLPPRKRAKTEDEKEQRRIERVLRNRQAAQSSRERKRQEVEKLEGEKIGIERQNYLLKERLMAVEHDKFRLSQQLAKMSAEISNLRSRAPSREPSRAPPSGVPSPALTADLLNHDLVIKQELEDYPFALPSPEDTLDPRSSFSDASSRASSRSPSPSRSNMEFNGIVTSPDMTQHPAAMLCGLQYVHSIHACDTTPLSDVAFGRLFNTPSTPEPSLTFFEEGLAAENATGEEDANAFSFDSMVDLEAGELDHADDMFSSSSLTVTSPLDFPHQPAATSSGLQPRLGASS